MLFFLNSSSSGTVITQMLVHLILSQRSLRLSSILFIPFPSFCSSGVISTILSSSLLIHSSASVILLLVPSRVFLISVIVLFISGCLFFISSMSLVIVLNVFNCVKCFFHFLHSFSSLQSIFTIFILNSLSGRLLISSLFGLVSFYLALSFVLYFSLFSSFFFSNLLHLVSPFPRL